MRMSRKRGRVLRKIREERELADPAFPNFMRMTRRRRRRLQKMRLAEGIPLPAFPNSMRMTRQRRLRLIKKRLAEGLHIPAFPHLKRMTRQRKRQMRDREEFSKDLTQAAAASLSTIYVMHATPLHTHATSLTSFSDVSAHFDYMKNARDRIEKHKEAEELVLHTRENRLQAEEDVLKAGADVKQAEDELQAAEDQLTAMELQRSRLKVALQRARDASERKTQLAIASQQAVADFLPQVYAQLDEVNRLQAIAYQRESEYVSYRDSVPTQTVRRTQRDVSGPTAARRAEIIEETWQSVGYAQNRLKEVQALVEQKLAQESSVDETTYEVTEEISEEHAAELSRYEERMASASRQAGYAQSVLYDLEAQLDSLKSQQAQAEGAEAEARQEVANLEKDQQQAELDRQKAETDLEEMKRLLAEAQVRLQDAKDLREAAIRDQVKAEYDLEHFGEGHSYGLGMEYYSWHGNRSGHQFNVPLEISGTEDGWDWSLETGYVNSSSGKENGNVSGWASTDISASVHNDNPVNDVSYKLAVHVPTGSSEVHQNANLPEDLARYTNFSRGWEWTSQMDVTRHITERDTLSGRMSWTWRSGYDIRRDGNAALSASPGSIWRQEGEYLHAGESHQFLGILSHQSSTMSRIGNSTYKDGDEYALKLFYSKDISPKDSWQVYGMLNYGKGVQGRGALDSGGSVWSQYYGMGWTHEFRKGQSLWTRLNYMKSNGFDYDYASGQATRDRTRWSIQLGYEHELSDTNALQVKLEQYSLKDAEAGNYRGWNGAVMFFGRF